MVDLNRTDIVDNGMSLDDAPESIKQQAAFIAAYEKQFESKPENEEQAPEVETQEEAHSGAHSQTITEAEVPSSTHTTKEDEEYKKLEQKYKSLQGMFNSQGRQIQDLTKRLEDTLTKLEKKPEPPQAEVKPREVKKRVTDKDRENLGDELEGTITRLAQDAADQMIAQREAEWIKTQKALEEKNAQLETQLIDLSKQQVESVESKFREKLEEAIPHFTETDSDVEFIAWLDEEDLNSGLAYKQILGNAYHQRNVARIKRLYTSWQELSGRYTEQPKAPNRDIQKQVQPTRTRAAPRLPTTTHNKIWSESEVAKFYQANREAIMHNDPEVMKVAAEIDKALNEGRIK